MSTSLTRQKRVGKGGHVYWRSKKYTNSIRLRKKKACHGASVADKNKPWRMTTEEPDSGKRTSEVKERDVFLELLSQVQDNRYEGQRYMLKADSLTDGSNPDEPCSQDSTISRDNDTSPANGSLANGGSSPGSPLPTVKVTTTRQNDDVSNGSGCGEEVFQREVSSPSPRPRTASPETPSHRSTEALKKMIAAEGPYPLVMEPPDGGFWTEKASYEGAVGEDGVWRAPEISTEHYAIQVDKTSFVYGRNFAKQEHCNYIGRDSKVGPVLFSLMFDEDYQGTIVRALLRTQKETVYRVFARSQVQEHMEPEDYIRHVSKMQGEEINVEKAIRITHPKAPELIQKFDEHPMAKTHKFGIVYQKFGQTSEEEIFGNEDHPPAFEEFLDVLGDKVSLRGFSGYRGGLDVCNDQTGETSIYTEYKDRKIMFHVSTLLPLDTSDTQHVQRKRHIGNDIVVIIFQDENTPFCPNMIRSHFVHSCIVVQVEHPNTDHTVYKVAVTAKDHVPEFGPPLPDPAIFQKGSEFRDWLLTKALNAEFNCHEAPDFLRLATRTRHQLFIHLVEELAQAMDDVDCPSLARDLISSMDSTTGASPQSNRRRRTLASLFNSTKENLHLPTFKRKSIAFSPKSDRKANANSTSRRIVMVGSTPDLSLTTSTEEEKHRSSPASVRSLTLTNCNGLGVEASQRNEKEGEPKLKRKLTFKKEKEKEKEKEKGKKMKVKRTTSEGGNIGVGLSNLFGGRKRKKQSMTAVSPKFPQRWPLKQENSSEESSIASGLNWSIPCDLPGAVNAPSQRVGRASLDNLTFSDSTEFREWCHSTPTILEKCESGVSISELRMAQNGPLTADVSVQVGQQDEVFKFPSHISPNGFMVVNGEESLSLPTTPSKLSGHRGMHMVQKLPTMAKIQEQYNQTGSSRAQGMRIRDPDERKKKILSRLTSSPALSSSPPMAQDLSSVSPSDDYTDGQRYSYENISRAESTESLSTEVDSVYDSLLNSLQSLTTEVSNLREHNLLICRENAKFATQNKQLKLKWSEAKQQLLDAQAEINKLQLKLRLYQPTIPESD